MLCLSLNTPVSYKSPSVNHRQDELSFKGTVGRSVLRVMRRDMPQDKFAGFLSLLSKVMVKTHKNSELIIVGSRNHRHFAVKNSFLKQTVGLDDICPIYRNEGGKIDWERTLRELKIRNDSIDYNVGKMALEKARNSLLTPKTRAHRNRLMNEISERFYKYGEESGTKIWSDSGEIKDDLQFSGEAIEDLIISRISRLKDKIEYRCRLSEIKEACKEVAPILIPMIAGPLISIGIICRHEIKSVVFQILSKVINL